MHNRSRVCFASFSLAMLTSTYPVFAEDAATPMPKSVTSAQPGTGGTNALLPKKKAASTDGVQPLEPAANGEDEPLSADTNESTAQDKKGQTPPEYKRPKRYSLSAGGSQRKDRLSGKDRFDWPSEFNAKKTLGLPDWLNMSLEFRTRYETLDAPFVKGQTGSQYQVPMQTVLWLEAHYQALRVGVEFWDARQYGSKPGNTLNNTMVDSGDFPQIYAALSTQNLLDSGLGAEVKGGRMTLDLGSRRLVARNAFRNTTNSFTGLLFRLRDGAGAWQMQMFATQPVVRYPDQASQLLHNDYAWDQEQQNSLFTGILGETNQLPLNSNGELYLYYLSENANVSSNNRKLYTPGFRLFRQAKKGEFDFEGESVGQTGSRIDTAYNANGVGTKKNMSVVSFYEHIQLGYTFDLPWDPRILLQYDYATGGTSGNGGTSNSFDTLYGARRWEYGPTGIFGPFARNNINTPGARAFVVPHRDVTAFIAYRAWWMADSKAAWQPANLVDPTGKSGDFMGHTVEISTRWDAHENVAIEGGWATLIKGNFARNAPGAPTDHNNVNYFYVQTQFRF